MIRLPRVPRARRSTIVLVFAVAALAFPLGVWANHQFDDVPTEASYHDDVEALVNAGVTTGCDDDPPLYCPSNPVTRAQMAQFLNRLGDLDGAATPSVNADTVDDIQAVDLMPGGNPPAGMTIRGVWNANGDAGDFKWHSYSFGYELSSAPTVNFRPAGSAATTACPGSATNPEAAFGNLCVYADAANTFGGADTDCIFSMASNLCGSSSRTGFGVATFGGAEDWGVAGTWAVTEPLIIILPPLEPPTDGPTNLAPDSD